MLGHENGLQFLWRGGRPLKDRSRKGPQNYNGDFDQNLAVNRDNDAASTSPHRETQGTCSEDDDIDYDNGSPFEPILQFLDLPLGVAVLHVAFPYLPTTDAIKQNDGQLPTTVSEKLVAAVVCSDSSVRLVTLPLAPPSKLCKRKVEEAGKPIVVDGRTGPFGEQIVVVSNGNDRRGISRCVSLTFVPSSAGHDSDLEMDEDNQQSARSGSRDRRRVKSKTRNRSPSSEGDDGWDILVASCSSDLSGLLLIHRVSLAPHGAGLDTRTLAQAVPWTVQHLPSAAASIHFNPSLPNDKRNSTLLVAEEKGPVRIFNCLPTRTTSQCSWLITLFPGSSSASPRGARKHLLHAHWVLGGKAILALFADGEWGVWDLENSGPKPQSGTQAPQVLTLGSFAALAITGWVNNGYKANTADRKVKDAGKPAKLAPATPGTRRFRQENLFSGPVGQFEGPAHGCISTLSLQNTKTDDEAVILWHNNSIIVIPSLLNHWSNKVRGSGNLFGNGAKGEARVISNVSLEGERRSDVCLLPRSNQSIYGDIIENDVLVLGETRFVVVAAPLSEPQTDSGASHERPFDRTVLGKGSLDLDGMDRVLASMNNRTQTGTSHANGAPPKRTVGFLDM